MMQWCEVMFTTPSKTIRLKNDEEASVARGEREMINNNMTTA